MTQSSVNTTDPTIKKVNYIRTATNRKSLIRNQNTIIKKLDLIIDKLKINDEEK